MGHHRDGDIFVFATGPGAAIDRAEVAAELNRAPARLNERPTQPFVALPEQAAVKYPPPLACVVRTTPAYAASLAGELNRAMPSISVAITLLKSGPIPGMLSSSFSSSL